MYVRLCEIASIFGFSRQKEGLWDHKCRISRVPQLLWNWYLSHVKFQSDLYCCDEVLI